MAELDILARSVRGLRGLLKGKPSETNSRTISFSAAAGVNSSPDRQKLANDDGTVMPSAAIALAQKSQIAAEAGAAEKATSKASAANGHEAAGIAAAPTSKADKAKAKAARVRRSQARLLKAREARGLAMLVAAEVHLTDRNADRAIDAFNAALGTDDLFGPAQRLRAYRGLTTAYLIGDDYRTAIRRLRRAIREDEPLRHAKWAGLAELMLAAGSPADAIAFLRSLIPTPESEQHSTIFKEGVALAESTPAMPVEPAVEGDPDVVTDETADEPPQETLNASSELEATPPLIPDERIAVENPAGPRLAAVEPDDVVEGNPYSEAILSPSVLVEVLEPAPPSAEATTVVAMGEDVAPPDPIDVGILLLTVVREYEGGPALIETLTGPLGHLRESIPLRHAALSQAAALKDVSIFRTVNALVAPVTMTHGEALQFASIASAQGQYADALAALSGVVDKPHTMPPNQTSSQQRRHNAASDKLRALHLELLLATGQYAEARRRLEVLTADQGLGAVGDVVRALFYFMDDAPDRASAAMTAGFTRHQKLLAHSVPQFDLSPKFDEWFEKANGRGEHEIFWRDEFLAGRQSQDAYITTLFRFAGIFVALRRFAVAYGLLGIVARWRGPFHERAGTLRRRLSITHMAQGRDIEPSIVTAELTAEDLSVDLVLAGVQGDEETMLERLEALRPTCASAVPLPPHDWSTIVAIARALIALQQGRHPDVATIIGNTGAAERMKDLDAEPDLTTIFLSGYGWSGSSALYDSLRAYPTVTEMLGAGESAHMNHGADSEPMLFEGPWGLNTIWASIYSSHRTSAEALWNFFRVHVVATLHQNYIELKSVHAAQRTHGQLGSAYVDAIALFVADLSSALCGDRGKYSISTLKPFRTLTGRLTKAIGKPTNAKYILINNGIRAFSIDASVLATKTVFISVLRDVCDQFVDQRRSNRYFRSSVESFLKQQRRRRLSFLAGKNHLLQTGLASEVFDVSFEDWVQQPELRAQLVRHLVGNYDPVLEARNFKPEISQLNIGIHHGAMSVQEEETVVVALEKSRTDLKAIVGDPFAGRLLRARRRH